MYRKMYFLQVSIIHVSLEHETVYQSQRIYLKSTRIQGQRPNQSYKWSETLG